MFILYLEFTLYFCHQKSSMEEIYCPVSATKTKIKRLQSNWYEVELPVTFSFFFKKLVFLILPWCCEDKTRRLINTWCWCESEPASADGSAPPSGRSVCPRGPGCRTPGRRRWAGTWSSTAARRECERTDLPRDRRTDGRTDAKTEGRTGLVERALLLLCSVHMTTSRAPPRVD